MDASNQNQVDPSWQQARFLAGKLKLESRRLYREEVQARLLHKGLKRVLPPLSETIRWKWVDVYWEMKLQLHRDLKPDYLGERMAQLLPGYKTRICEVGESVRPKPYRHWSDEIKSVVYTVTGTRVQVLYPNPSKNSKRPRKPTTIVMYRVERPALKFNQCHSDLPVSTWVDADDFMSVEEYDDVKRVAQMQLAVRKWSPTHRQHQQIGQHDGRTKPESGK